MLHSEIHHKFKFKYWTMKTCKIYFDFFGQNFFYSVVSCKKEKDLEQEI